MFQVKLSKDLHNVDLNILSFVHFRETYCRGNSFWRRSKLRLSQASNMSFLEAQLENGRQKFKSQEYKIRKTNFYGVYITCTGQIPFNFLLLSHTSMKFSNIAMHSLLLDSWQVLEHNIEQTRHTCPVRKCIC